MHKENINFPLLAITVSGGRTMSSGVTYLVIERIARGPLTFWLSSEAPPDSKSNFPEDYLPTLKLYDALTAFVDKKGYQVPSLSVVQAEFEKALRDNQNEVFLKIHQAS